MVYPFYNENDVSVIQVLTAEEEAAKALFLKKKKRAIANHLVDLLESDQFEDEKDHNIGDPAFRLGFMLMSMYGRGRPNTVDAALPGHESMDVSMWFLENLAGIVKTSWDEMVEQYYQGEYGDEEADADGDEEADADGDLYAEANGHSD